MFTVLLCTILGFLAGLSYVLAKRKIKPGALLAATLTGLLTTATFKILKDYWEKKKKNTYY